MKKEYEFGTETFGQTYKRIRVLKGYSLSYAAKDICSPQFLRKFESGESDITVTKLNRLLNKIYISWDEFIRENKGISIDTFINYHVSNIDKIMFNDNYDELEEYLTMMITRSKEFSESDSILFDNFCLQVNNINDFYISREVPKETKKIKEIKEKILKSKNGSNYELIMFTTFLYYLEGSQVVEVFTRFVDEFIETKYTTIQSENDLISLSFTCVSFLKSIGEIDLAIKVLDKIQPIIDNADEYNVFAKIIYKHKKGIMEIYKGNVQEGKNISEEALHIIDLFGGFEHYYRDFYKEQLEALTYIEKKQSIL